jgi:hypothetical protein
MGFLTGVSEGFTQYAEDCGLFVHETFEEHLGSEDLIESFIKSLKKIKIECDGSDIRSALDEDFNPGPYILIGVPIDIGGAHFSLIPGLNGLGRGNMTALTGVVAMGLEAGVPTASWGYRDGVTENPLKAPFAVEWETFISLGKFSVPTELKGYDAVLTETIVVAFLNYLSYGFGYAVLSIGLDALEKDREEVEPAINTMWKEYITAIEEAVETYG